MRSWNHVTFWYGFLVDTACNFVLDKRAKVGVLRRLCVCMFDVLPCCMMQLSCMEVQLRLTSSGTCANTAAICGMHAGRRSACPMTQNGAGTSLWITRRPWFQTEQHRTDTHPGLVASKRRLGNCSYAVAAHNQEQQRVVKQQHATPPLLGVLFRTIATAHSSGWGLCIRHSEGHDLVHGFQLEHNGLYRLSLAC